MFKNFIALVCGIIFSLGLLVSEMVSPKKIQDFLDITGQWDPSLALVMAGALLTLGGLQQLFIFKRPRPLLEEKFFVTNNNAIDLRLIIGAAIFGLGWGLAGFCPGPAIVALTLNPLEASLFVAGMVLGILLFNRLNRLNSASDPDL